LGEQFNGIPLTFPKLEAFANEKEKYKKIIARDSANIAALPQVSIAAGWVSNMHQLFLIQDYEPSCCSGRSTNESAFCFWWHWELWFF
jgi:hypothetical protein